MKIIHQLGAGAATLTLVACASSPDKIDAAYVSPIQYESYSCKQISAEMDYVGKETTRLYSELKDESTADAWQMGVGLVLFWPSLFLLEGGDGPQAAEYAQLSGEFEALKTVSVEKECGLAFRSPEEIMKSADRKNVLAESKVIADEKSASDAFPASARPEESLHQPETGDSSNRITVGYSTIEDATRFAISKRCYNGLTEINRADDIAIYETQCESGTLFIKCEDGKCRDLNGTSI